MPTPTYETNPDLAPLLVYAAGLSGRNPETLKELPAEHRFLEEGAVAVTLTKRRRGKANSRTTVHWSVDPDRELRTMGSFYLLLHRLMGHSRTFSGTGSVGSIWAGDGRGGVRNVATGHIGPFDAELARKRAGGHGAGGGTAEPGPTGEQAERGRCTGAARPGRHRGGPAGALHRLAVAAATEQLLGACTDVENAERLEVALEAFGQAVRAATAAPLSWWARRRAARTAS